MMQFVGSGSSIPRMDRGVEHVGVSRLRKLNSYEKYLVLQDKLDSLMTTIFILNSQKESAALRSGIEDVNKGRTRDLNEIKVGLNKKK
jgi:hypothetical protein